MLESGVGRAYEPAERSRDKQTQGCMERAARNKNDRAWGESRPLLSFLPPTVFRL